MKQVALIAVAVMGLAITPLCGTVAAQDDKQPNPGKLIVHEWGTFTSVAGADGVALEWRPLKTTDLPSFVYNAKQSPRGLRHGAPCVKCEHFGCACGDECKGDGNGKGGCGCKGCYVATVRMETPVLYFYAEREGVVEVKVDFPKGKVTEWYPMARETSTGINWGGVRVQPGSNATFPRESAESHYYPARETDANPVQVCGYEINAHDYKYLKQNEKFLFYRGVGTFDLPLQAKMEDNKLRLKNLTPHEISQVVTFVNRSGKISYSIKCYFNGEAVQEIPKRESSMESLLSDFEKILTSQGLYGKEAKAMLKTWRDSWFEEGTRLFYVVPRKVTDEVLPISINPKPAELVRVLVGRLEIITPEREKQIRALVEKLGDESQETREVAMAELRKLGRFAEPALKRALGDASDAEIKWRVKDLLKQLSQ